MLEIKLSEMKNFSDGLINGLHTAEERINKFENRSIEIMQNETKRKKKKQVKKKRKEKS